jgi:hypothetical protein
MEFVGCVLLTIGGVYMLNKDDISEAVSLDLLKRGYSILKKPKGRKRGADIIARDPESKTRVFISAAGRTESEASEGKPLAAGTESQVLECMTRSVYSALRMRSEEQFSPGDQIALAFPDVPECRRYLSVEKPVLDSLGVKIMLVKEDKEVAVL